MQAAGNVANAGGGQCRGGRWGGGGRRRGMTCVRGERGGEDDRASAGAEPRPRCCASSSQRRLEGARRGDAPVRGTAQRGAGLDQLEGSKGKPPHLIQMGAMVRAADLPRCGRVVANVAHFKPDAGRAGGARLRARVLPRRPWAMGLFLCGDRWPRRPRAHGLVPRRRWATSRSASGTNMSDLHAKAERHDPRLPRPHRPVGLTATTPKTPPFWSPTTPASFTPVDKASPKLVQLQKALLDSRARLYELSRYLPKKFLAPVNLARLLERANSAEHQAAAPDAVYPELAALLNRPVPAAFALPSGLVPAAFGPPWWSRRLCPPRWSRPRRLCPPRWSRRRFGGVDGA